MPPAGALDVYLGMVAHELKWGWGGVGWGWGVGGRQRAEPASRAALSSAGTGGGHAPEGEVGEDPLGVDALGKEGVGGAASLVEDQLGEA